MKKTINITFKPQKNMYRKIMMPEIKKEIKSSRKKRKDEMDF